MRQPFERSDAVRGLSSLVPVTRDLELAPMIIWSERGTLKRAG